MRPPNNRMKLTTPVQIAASQVPPGVGDPIAVEEGSHLLRCLGSESVALESNKLLKGSRLVWLDRCGHFPWIEQPEAFEKAVFEFLFPQGP